MVVDAIRRIRERASSDTTLEQVLAALERGVVRGSPRLVGTYAGIPLYVHDSIKDDTIYMLGGNVNASFAKSCAKLTFAPSRAPWSWSMPYPRHSALRATNGGGDGE